MRAGSHPMRVGSHRIFDTTYELSTTTKWILLVSESVYILTQRLSGALNNNRQSSGKKLPPYTQVSDYLACEFLDSCTKTRHARNRRRVALDFLHRRLGYSITVGDEARRKLPTNSRTKSSSDGKPAMESRWVRHIELLTVDSTKSLLQRQLAALALHGPMFSLRFANLQAAGRLYRSGAFLRGVCADFKKDEDLCLDRQMVTSATGPAGTSQCTANIH